MNNRYKARGSHGHVCRMKRSSFTQDKTPEAQGGLCRLLIACKLRSQRRNGPMTSAASNPRKSIITALVQNLTKSWNTRGLGMSKHTAFPQLPLDGVRKFQNAARSVTDQRKETCGLQGMSPSGEERPSPSNSGSKVSSRQLLCGRGEVWNLFFLSISLHRRGRCPSRLGSPMGVHGLLMRPPGLQGHFYSTHNSLVSKPDDLRFGVSLSPAGKVHCVP